MRCASPTSGKHVPTGEVPAPGGGRGCLRTASYHERVIPPKVTRPMAAVAQDWTTGRYPWQLLVAVVSWLVVAASLLTSRIGAPRPTDADAQQDVLDSAGTVLASNAQDQWFVPLLPWLGVVVALVAVALLLGQGWTRVVLAGCGLVAVVGLATAAAWQAFPAMLGFLLGCVVLVLPPVHRYLQGARADHAAVGPTAATEPSERSVTS